MQPEFSHEKFFLSKFAFVALALNHNFRILFGAVQLHIRFSVITFQNFTFGTALTLLCTFPLFADLLLIQLWLFALENSIDSFHHRRLLSWWSIRQVLLCLIIEWFADCFRNSRNFSNIFSSLFSWQQNFPTETSLYAYTLDEIQTLNETREWIFAIYILFRRLRDFERIEKIERRVSSDTFFLQERIFFRPRERR